MREYLSRLEVSIRYGLPIGTRTQHLIRGVVDILRKVFGRPVGKHKVGAAWVSRLESHGGVEVRLPITAGRRRRRNLVGVGRVIDRSSRREPQPFGECPAVDPLE